MTVTIGPLPNFVLFFSLVCFMFVFGQTLVEHLYCNKGLFRSKGPFPRLELTTKKIKTQLDVICSSMNILPILQYDPLLKLYLFSTFVLRAVIAHLELAPARATESVTGD